MHPKTMKFLLLPVLVILCLLQGCESEKLPFYTSSRPATSWDCASCHSAIYLDWKDSTHAAAWTNPQFMALLEDTGTMACFGCHAPAPLLAPDGQEPPVRTINLMEGVNCTACHLAQCPHHLLEDARTLPDTARILWNKENSSKSCGACHQETYQEWLDYTRQCPEEDPARTCVDCHMKPISTRVIRPDQEVASAQTLRRTQLHHDHSFVPSPLEALTIEAGPFESTASGEMEVELFILNHGSGHRIPTGRFGFKEVRLEAWLDKGESGDVQGKSFYLEMGSSLGPGRNGPFTFVFDRGDSAFHARVVRRNGDGKVIAVLGHFTSREIDGGSP